MTEPFIQLQSVGRIYSSGSAGGAPVAALSDITLFIRNGERVGIVGSNGAGKSTLLQIVAGVNTPTTGSIQIEGRVHAILTVGLGLREEATGRENLFLEGALLGKTREDVEAKLQAMIDFAELGEFIDQPVRTYSSGMKSRLSFASLVHIDPEILIIDEALSVGDAFFAAKASRMMQDLCTRGSIILLVTHSVSAIQQMCKRCIWLDGGKVRADGPADTVSNAYAAETRVRQETAIASKFSGESQSWATDPHVAVSGLRLVQIPDKVETVVIEAGTPAALRFKLTTNRPLVRTDLRVRIESNDGLLLADETIGFAGAASSGGSFTISVGLGVVDWRPFLYQAHVDLRERGTSISGASVAFKVFSDITIFGGSPLLRTAPAVRTVAIDALAKE